MLSVFLNDFLSHFCLRQSPTEPGWPMRVSLSLSPDYKLHPAFNLDPEQGLPACPASTFPTEPSQPQDV